MSSAERFVRHHKQRLDRAISQAYVCLAGQAPAAASFHALLQCVRERAPGLLRAPIVEGRHPGVESLINLSRFADAHIRRIVAWPGTAATWRAAVSSLADHLVGVHPAPRFLAAAWYATDAHGERKRRWFIAHARGASFRSLDLPVAMTRRMEHIFLTSRDHLGIEEAMRRAELLALGASDDLLRAVLATRPATDLQEGAFWRTVWTFLVANAGAIDPAQVAPLIDFVDAIRHQAIEVETPAGVVMRPPIRPSFSMQGRTPASMLRLMQDWHRSPGAGSDGPTWARSPMRPLLIEEPSPDPEAPPVVWRLMELTTAAQLRAEGAALRHCVASYAHQCWRGATRIWSLRVERQDHVRHLLTIEVDLRARAVVQARGVWNRPAHGKPLRLLQEWAARERLRLTL